MRQPSFKLDKDKLDNLEPNELVGLVQHYMDQLEGSRKEVKELEVSGTNYMAAEKRLNNFRFMGTNQKVAEKKFIEIKTLDRSITRSFIYISHIFFLLIFLSCVAITDSHLL